MVYFIINKEFTEVITMYDYLVVGSGLYGASFARQAADKGLKVLVIEKNNVIGGSIRTERKDDIDIHIYGAHIFHTSDKEVYDFFTKFCHLNNFINEPLANYKGKLYHLPFNMNTFYALWGTKTPAEAKAMIEKQKKEANIKTITNLEEQAISLVGKDVYEILVKGYTEKQWGRSCKELDPSIIRRLPCRFVYNNNYFNDFYQGIPVEGYTHVIEKMLENIEVKTGIDFIKNRDSLKCIAKRIIYTGPIDEYFDFKLGELSYRTLRFETERLEQEDYQGNAVINYTEREIPFTRIIEHKHFTDATSPVTYITREYPKEFVKGDRPYYPINDERNSNLYKSYLELAKEEKNTYFCGRLGQYKYFDMDDTIRASLDLFKKLEN